MHIREEKALTACPGCSLASPREVCLRVIISIDCSLLTIYYIGFFYLCFTPPSPGLEKPCIWRYDLFDKLFALSGRGKSVSYSPHDRFEDYIMSDRSTCNLQVDHVRTYSASYLSKSASYFACNLPTMAKLDGTQTFVSF